MSENRFWNTVALLAVALVLALTAAASAQPVPFTVQCVQTVTGGNALAYSGDSAFWQASYGFIAFRPAIANGLIVNGIGKPDPGACQSPVTMVGDCWQSVTTLTASNGTKKWIVTPGSPSNCPPGPGLAVWKWTTSWHWIGFVPILSQAATANRGGTVVLTGDVAYVPLVQPGWVACDLNAMTCNMTPLQSIPPGEGRQQNANGATWSLAQVGTQQAKTFLATGSGGGVVTPTPAPTAAPTPVPTQGSGNPYALAMEALYRAGITAGCNQSPLMACPERLMTRQEVAAWLAKAINLPMLACVGKFADMPCPIPALKAVQP